MRIRSIQGESVSAVGLGTWQFGSREWGYGAGYALGTAVELVYRALERGVNLIDTAELYGFGASERIIGDALKDRGDEDLREAAFLATKFYPILPISAMVTTHCYRSAQRLKVNQIDLYQMHFPNPLVPMGVQMVGARRLVERGVVRKVGVSNYSLSAWQSADRALGFPTFSNQVHFSLLKPEPLKELLPWAQTNDRLIIAYSPLEQGILSGKFGDGSRPKDFRRLRPGFSPGRLERIAPLIDLLRQLGSEVSASPAQVALAWLLHHPNVAVIPGASSLSQLESNIDAASLELNDRQVAALTELAVSLGR
jgi:aryl-alcohol dehydrogenase-like predicted oxidoreductase